MKNFIGIVFSLIFTIHAEAQQTKGVKVPSETMNSKGGKTYALIVGISKYQNPKIPSLQFADKDADIFRQYLISSGVDSNNITILLNEKATSGEFWSSIAFLVDIVKKDDRLILYFSGHGDFETKNINKDAYLLTYESPDVMYVRSAVPVYHLQSWLETFSSKGVQVIFIADACHSGNLAGGREGKQALVATLKENWKSEIKILSCQPGELSLEGNQWGGGRGLFSFELTNALAGHADKNGDGEVSLGELNRYLNLKVPEQADPLPQYPQVNGNMETSLGKVNLPFLSRINSFTDSYSKVDLKGFDESLLDNLHDSVKNNYHLFKMYLDSGIFAERLNSPYSSYYYYQRIPKDGSTTMLVAVMKRNLSAALIDRLNLKLNSYTENIFNITQDEMAETRRENKVLVELLGIDKLKSLGYYPKALFFDIAPTIFGKAYANVNKIDSDYNERSRAFAINNPKGTSFNQDMNSSMANSDSKDFKIAEANSNIILIDSALKYDSGATYLYTLRGRANYIIGDYPEGSSDFRKCTKLRPNWGMGYVFSAAFSFTDHTAKARLRYALENFNHRYDRIVYVLYCGISDANYEPDSLEYYALKFLKEPLVSDSSYAAIDCREIGNSLYEFKRYSSALLLLNESKKLYAKQIRKNRLQSNTKSSNDYLKEIDYKIAMCYLGLDDVNQAVFFLNKSLEEGYDDYKAIDYNYDLDKIRNTPEFEKLMKKYFPEQFKK
ncbi:MAG: caspase domain-containing protein [Bacteroidia bacterium]